MHIKTSRAAKVKAFLPMRNSTELELHKSEIIGIGVHFDRCLRLISMPRCPWATAEPNASYHDTEWGVPVHDDRKLFEFLILEGAQAGLSWTTILNKRKNYRKAFDGFRAHKIARYGPRDMKRLLNDPGIVRNRLKIAATIQNAKAFLAVRELRRLSVEFRREQAEAKSLAQHCSGARSHS